MKYWLLANCLTNIDFFVSRGVVIRKDADKIIMENPGYIRTGKDQMLKGAISDPRNKALMKMFNIIGIGERAGSGVPDIYDIWKAQGWETPVVEEQYNPDRTILTLPFVRAERAGAVATPKYQNDTLDDTLEILILEQIGKNPKVKQTELVKITGSSIATIKRTMKKMVEQGAIQREGGKRNGAWMIIK